MTAGEALEETWRFLERYLDGRVEPGIYRGRPHVAGVGMLTVFGGPL